MPWSGGNFSRTNGTYTGTEVWQDVTANVSPPIIESSEHDTHDQDLADGIDACINRDGSTAMTGDLDMGGNDITNLGRASLKAFAVISASETLSTNGEAVMIDASGGAVTVTVPGSISEGIEWSIHAHDDGNTITVDASAHTLNFAGAAVAGGTFTMEAGDFVRLVSEDASNVEIVHG